MFEIGASLREARERRGLALDDVQKRLRLRERYVRALEEERWELLPGDAYARGFLRMYAEFLGLNGTLYLDEYDARVARGEEEPIVPESLAPRRHGNLLTRTIAGVVAVGLLVVAAAAWRPPPTAAPHVEAASAATPKPVVQPGMPVAPVVLPTTTHAPPRVASIRALTRTSWLSVRLGGHSGREVFRGFLLPGHRLSYRLGSRVWVRIGRPHAVVVRIGGRRVRGLPQTAANVLLTRRGPLAG